MSLQHLSSLPVPPIAAEDPKAIELLRVWAAGGKQHVTLATGVWRDPAHWGVMLVDLAKHVANAYAQTDDADVAQVLERIKFGFDAEWGDPTDSPSGHLLQ